MKKFNVLITGSNGMLGKDIVYILSSTGKFNIHGINRTMNVKSNIKEYICDLTNFNMLKSILKEINPDIIIHCAANVNVDSCESDKNYAYKINSESVKILASYNPSKSKFIYISTDSVFNGMDENYKEEDMPNPLNYYAFTKLQGEKLALLENPRAIVIRTNIYGFHIPGQNSLVEWAFKNLIKGNSISGFNDVYFNPVYTRQLARSVYKLVDMDFEGLINIGCKEKLSKYDFLVKLSNIFKLDINLIEKISIDNIDFKAKRPKNTTLNTEKFNSITDIELNFDDGLRELYEEYKNSHFIGRDYNERD